MCEAIQQAVNYREIARTMSDEQLLVNYSNWNTRYQSGIGKYGGIYTVDVVDALYDEILERMKK